MQALAAVLVEWSASVIRIDAAWLATDPLDMRAGMPAHKASRIEELLPHRWIASNTAG